MNVFITGVSRGIGQEMAKQALAAGHKVVGVSRKPISLKGDFHLIETDVTDPKTGDRLVEVAEKLGHVDVLINNAGILRQGSTVADFQESFLVNSITPFKVTEALLPYLKKAKSPKVAHITSLMGSIADNGSGGYYSYRASKAALNMINMSLSHDHKWLTTLVLHPGWVKTDMGGAGAPVTVEESASGLWKVINGKDKNETGGFFDFRGKELPW